MLPELKGLWDPLGEACPSSPRNNPNPSLERNPGVFSTPSPGGTGKDVLHRRDHGVAALATFATNPSTRQRPVFRSLPTRIELLAAAHPTSRSYIKKVRERERENPKHFTGGPGHLLPHSGSPVLKMERNSPGLQPKFSLLAVWPWASFFASLCLSFFCKMGIENNAVFPQGAVKIK